MLFFNVPLCAVCSMQYGEFSALATFLVTLSAHRSSELCRPSVSAVAVSAKVARVA